MSGVNLLVIPRIPNKFEKDRIEQFISILELSGEKFKLLYHLKEPKLRKIVNSPFIEPVCMNEYLKEKSWKKAYQMLDGIGEIKQIIVLLNILSENKHLGEEAKVKKDYDLSLTKDDYATSFMVLNLMLKYIHAIIYLANKRKCPVKHIIYDPQEFIYDSLVPRAINYYFYTLEKNNSSFFPYIEYGFFYKVKNASIDKLNKDYDFTFGCSIITHDRDYIQAMVDTLQTNLHGHNVKLFITNKFTGEDTHIPFPEYFNYLRKSKFTLVIPSYDKEEFSRARFLEALAVDCIPLIFNTCKLDKAFVENPDFLAIINKYLLVDENTLPQALSLDYDKILNELKETNDYKKLLDINYYKKHVKEFMECM